MTDWLDTVTNAGGGFAFNTATLNQATSATSADPLRRVVDGVRYKPGWRFALKAQAGDSLLLEISLSTTDSGLGGPMLVTHLFPVPCLLSGVDRWSKKWWERWVLDCILLVERHEACEFFDVEGERPFYPGHGDEHPYRLKHVDDR